MPSLLTCHLCSKTLLLILLVLRLSILKSSMSADQAAKLAHQLTLLTNAFLDLVLEYKEKTYIYHVTKKTASKVIRKRLDERSRPSVRISASTFLLIFYLR